MKCGQWISVTERLPEYGQECIIFDKNYGGLYGIFVKGKNNLWETKENGYQYAAGEDVTHWMPAPNEPNADKKKLKY